MKTFNNRPRSGPITKEEMMDYFERGYHAAAKRFIAKRWQVNGTEDEEIVDGIFKNKGHKKAVNKLTDRHKAVLASFLEKGGRARGENIRRELLLKGFSVANSIIRDLVQAAILIPLPNPGEAELDIEPLVDASSMFLQRDLAILDPLVSILGPLDKIDIGETAVSYTGDVQVELKGDGSPLELNLLHLTSLLLYEQLRLNKSGTPNRRSLSRFARGIILPGTIGEADEELDLNDTYQMDYLAFLLALALELKILIRNEKSIVADGKEMTKYFTAPTSQRDKILAHAIQNLKLWSEVQSNDLSRSIEEAERQLSQSSPTGEPLIPARGYLFSLLKRSQLGEWTALSLLNDLALALDEDFLPTTLSPILSHSTNQPVTPSEFIEAHVKRLMYWTGIADIGKAEDENGKTIEVIRFTPRGRHMIGMTMDKPLKDESDVKGALIVQPNKEIILFLAIAPLKLAFEIYQIAERQNLTDQVAHFSMSSESVQRGYAYGSSAETIIETIKNASSTPIPEAIIFELQDWERMHKRQRIYANGVLIRHNSADALDLIIGQLNCENRERPDVEIIILGPTSAFVTTPTAEGLDRLIECDDPFLIDYLGENPPQFSFVDPLVIMLQPIEIDIITQVELVRIANKQDEKLGNSEFWELDIEMIKQRWPEDSLQNVVEFLSKRCEGGLPVSQYIILKSQLDEPPVTTIVRGHSVLEVSKVEDADAIERVEDLENVIARRLGPTAFLVQTGAEKLLTEVFEELGIEVKS